MHAEVVSKTAYRGQGYSRETSVILERMQETGSGAFYGGITPIHVQQNKQCKSPSQTHSASAEKMLMTISLRSVIIYSV